MRPRVLGPRAKAARLDLRQRVGRRAHVAVCSEYELKGTSMPQCGHGACMPSALATFSRARHRMFVGAERHVGHLAHAGCLEHASHSKCPFGHCLAGGSRGEQRHTGHESCSRSTRLVSRFTSMDARAPEGPGESEGPASATGTACTCATSSCSRLRDEKRLASVVRMSPAP